jgi:sugar lactone lactonase YvrE
MGFVRRFARCFVALGLVVLAGCGGSSNPNTDGGAGKGGSSAGAGGRGGDAGTGGSAGSGSSAGVGGTAGSAGRGGSGGTAGIAGTGGSAGSGGTPVNCALPPTDGGTDGGGSPDGGGGPDGGALPDNVVFVPNVTVSTLTGGATSGAANGAAGTASFDNPVSIAIGPSGAMVVSDYENGLLRGVATDGAVTTIVQQSSFQRPYGVTFAGSTLYAQTDANPSGIRNSTTGTIWRIDIPTGVATPIAPNLGRPRAIAALGTDRLVLADVANQRLQVFNVDTGALSDLAGLMGCPGSANGTGPSARFMEPYGVVALANGHVIVSDAEAHLLRDVSSIGVVTSFAGDGIAGTIDGPAASARFRSPKAIAADASGAVFVSDTEAHRIRRIAADGTVTTVAGNGVGGFMDGAGSAAQFFGQEGLAVSADGRTLFVADGTGGAEPAGPYHRVRKITIAP